MQKAHLLTTIALAASLALITTSIEAKPEHQQKTVRIKQEQVIKTKININKADAKTLATLKGIGVIKAKDIIAFREKNGNFKTVDDLSRVKGISQKIIDANKARLNV